MIYEDAKKLADKYARLLEPGCVRLEIVGSVKRGVAMADVHDIEFLLIPDERRGRPEFGQKIPPINFYRVLNKLESEGLLRYVMGKDRLRKYAITEVRTLNQFLLELYIVQHETWGIQNVIRTGPSLFSHAYVTNRSREFFDENTERKYHGLLPDDLTYVVGETKILAGGQPLNLPEERDALMIIGQGWVEPRDRLRLVR